MLGSRKLLALLAVIAMLVAACGDDGGGAGNGGAGDGDAAPIKIGVVVAITGSASSLGEPERNTIQLYQDEFSEIAGHPVEWIIEDSASDPTQAVTTVKRLIQQEDVHAVVCCTISPNSMAILEVVQPAEVPNISLAAAASIVEPAEEREWVFKTPQNDALMVDLISDHMLDQGIGSVAFLGFDDSYGESGLVEFEEIAGQKGIEVTGTQTYAREDTDVTAQLTQLQRGDPDAYLIWAIPPGAVVAQENLKNLGIEEQVYQSHGVANSAFLKLGGDAVEGTFLPAGKLLVAEELPDDDPQKEILLDYMETYEADYGEGSANTFGGHAYDAMLVLDAAIEGAVDGGADPADLEGFRSALRDEIEGIDEFAGISGVFDYSEDDHHGLDRRAAVMLRVENNDWVLESLMDE